MGIHIKRLQLHNIIKELDETKCVLKSRKPKTDRECNCQEKEDKHTNSDLQNITQKTKSMNSTNSTEIEDELGCFGKRYNGS